jgi:hypothetical protein
VKTMKYLVRFVAILIILLVSFAVTGFGSATPKAHAACPPIAGYPTFGFDTGRSSFNPFECVISPLAAPPFNWVSPLGLPIAPREGISTDNVRGYVGQGNALVAFLLATGGLVCGFGTPGAVVGSATVFLGNIYFGNQAGDFFGLNPGCGLLCHIGLGGAISTTPIGITIGGRNIVIVSRDNGIVFGIDVAACAILWATPIPLPAPITLSSPSLSRSIALVSTQVNPANSRVFGLNALTGAIVGATPVLPGTFTPPAVAAAVGQFFVGSSNPAVGVIDFTPAFGVNWIRPIGEPVLGKPAVDFPAAAGQVYAVSATTGRLFALNAATGVINWISVAPCGPLYRAASPTVANGGVYVGGQKCINAFKTTGGATWGIGVGVLVDSPATVVNGILLFTANVGGPLEQIFSF